MRGLLAVFLCQLVLCGPLLAAQLPEITGAVAYTETIRFDYTKDGTRDLVQFWLEFKGSPALGKPGEAGYIPESGAIYYYLVDVEHKKQVNNWLMGFSMMEEPPPSGPYPIKNIHIQGNQATFEAFGMKWTVIDGGQGSSKDTVTINDGFITRDMKLHDGDLRIVNTGMEISALYQDCRKCLDCHKDPAMDLNLHIDDLLMVHPELGETHTRPQACISCYECHEDPVKEMVAKGGEHAAMECAECHAGHPPEEQQSYTACTECHEPHSDRMVEDDCGRCHRAHNPAEVMYTYNVPSRHCTACHQEVADALASNPSKHSDMACALCHQERHKASSTCQYCHGAPHPKHVMKKEGICGDCHHTAHDLERAQAQ